jgi:hypothetical protein
MVRSVAIRTRDLLRYECVSLLDLVPCGHIRIQFGQSYLATYRDSLLWRLQQGVICYEGGIGQKLIATNRRGELGNEETRCQHQPDKTRFEAQVVYSKVREISEGLFPDLGEDSLSLVHVMYSSGEPL